MDYLLQVFKALAHDRRLRIIELLSERHELTIEVLSSELKIPFASCCRNLKILERVYIVKSRRAGGYVFYSLNKPDDHIYNRHILDMVLLRKKKLSEKSLFILFFDCANSLAQKFEGEEKSLEYSKSVILKNLCFIFIALIIL